MSKPCPFCGSRDTERRADFSTALMVSLYACRRCRSYFEAIKWGDAEPALDLPGFLAASRQPAAAPQSSALDSPTAPNSSKEATAR